MAERAFAALVPRIQGSVPGCPHATIVQYIRDAVIRTCERTLYWRYQVPLFTLLPGVSEYVYRKPVNTDVHVVFEAIVNDRPLKRLTFDEALEVYPQWDAVSTRSTPQVICQITPERYVVLPVPDDTRPYQMRMFVVLKPKRTATGMNEFIMDELEELIMHGTLQHLLVLPDQVWSDRELAAYHAKQYVSQTAERRARANLGNVRGVMQVRMQSFGA